jgi:hypothetical protein
MSYFKTLGIITSAIFFISCAGSRPANNSYDFKEITRLTQNPKINKILIVGSGGINTHFFLDNVSEELRRKFENVKIETGYEFLGYKKDFTSQLNTLISNGRFDAILQFAPLNDVENNAFVANSNRASSQLFNNNRFNSNITRAAVRFRQDFTVTLFIKNNSASPLWKASLNTNLDSRERIFYTRIANDIVNNLKGIYN